MSKYRIESKFVRLVSLVLILSTLFLCACNKGESPEVSTEAADGSGEINTNTTTTTTTTSDTEQKPEPEPALDMISMTFSSIGNGSVKDNSKTQYEVDEKTGIVTVKHGGTDSLYNAAKYCVLFQFNDPSVMEAKYKYVRVIYSAKNPEGADSVALKIRDNAVGGASDVTLATITSDTDGFVVSNVEQMAISSLSRLLDGTYDTWLFETNLEGGEYCIKGVYFFKSYDEAKKLTVEYADKLMAEEQKKAEEEAAKITRVSMDFSEGGNVTMKTNQYTHDASSVADGVITVSKSEERLYSTTRYMTIPKFNQQKMISAQHKYIRVLYSVENPAGLSSVPVLLRATATGETITLVSGAYNTNGYTLSDTASMSNGIISAFILQNDVAIIFDTNTDGGVFRVKGVYFFATQQEADAFTVENAVTVELPSELNPVGSNYPALTLGTNGSCAYTNTKNTNYTPDVATNSIKINYSGETVMEWASTRYLIKVKFPSEKLLDSSYKYVRIAYCAANPTGESSVDLVLRTDGTDENDIIAATVTAATDGFVLSDAIELNTQLLNRWINGNHNSLFFKTATDGGEYYVYGIYFFDSMTEAQAANLSDLMGT